LYIVQPNTPLYLQNFAHPDKACNWLGVAGQVFDKKSSPVNNVVVVVDGILSGKVIDQMSLTGLDTAYGSGGFEIVIANQALMSTSPLTVTLFDLAGKALTLPVPFNTLADCKKNLVLVNFIAK
jgi:hypothetical protein